MKAGTKNKEVLAGIPAPPCFSQRHPPTPFSSEDYSLEPWGNSLLLVQTVLSVDPVSAYRRVRLTSQKTTRHFQDWGSLWFYLCFYFSEQRGMAVVAQITRDFLGAWNHGDLQPALFDSTC